MCYLIFKFVKQITVIQVIKRRNTEVGNKQMHNKISVSDLTIRLSIFNQIIESKHISVSEINGTKLFLIKLPYPQNL